MKQTLLSFFVGSMILTSVAFAQEKKVSGRVTAADGKPLAGVTIAVQGSNLATQTDANGNYSFSVPTGKVIVFRSIGFSDKTLIVKEGQSAFNVTLDDSANALDEVVVTALGIQRQKKDLGYSTATVSNKELNTVAAMNVANGLQGKVSGLNVTTVSSGVFETSKMNLRGIRSLTGNNNPLLVVDGVSMDLKFLSSINPNDIGNVSVLKGSSAAAIYGPDSRNGVIVVTTKKGSDEPVITVGNSTQFQNISFFPSLQKTFGQGYAGEFDPVENMSWGEKFDGSQLKIGPVLPDGSQQTVLSAANNDRKGVYETGHTIQNDVSLAMKDYFLSFQDANVKGISPGDKNRRTGMRLNSSREFGKFKTGVNVNYSQQNYDVFDLKGSEDYHAAQGVGGNNALFNQLINTPANIPLLSYKNYKTDKFAEHNGYYTNYGLNPYLLVGNWRKEGKRQDFISNFDLNYATNDWLNFTYRAGMINQNTVERNKSYGATATSFGLDRDKGSIPISIEEYNYTQSRLSSEFFATVNKDLDDDFKFNAVVGTYVRQDDSRKTNVGANTLIVEDIFNLGNRLGNLTGSSLGYKSRLFSVYASAGLNYRGWANLEVTGRMDKTSVLALNNNTYYYPGVAASAVLTEAIPAIKSDNFNYLKLRGSWNRTGNADINPYLLAATFSQPGNNGFPFGSTSGFTAGDVSYDPNLKPEFISSSEFGFESAFFNNRVKFEATYYYQSMTDQIMSVRVSESTGYRSKFVNAASFVNKGLELDLNLSPLIKFRDGGVHLRANATFSDSEVTDIYKDQESGEIQIGTAYSAVGNYAIKGQPANVWKATDYVRDDQGRVIVDANTGLPSVNNLLTVQGRTMPKLILGINPSIDYKSFTLSALFEHKSGHKVSFQELGRSMAWTGVSEATAYNDRQPFILPNSVIADPSNPGQFIENTTAKTGSTAGGVFDYYTGVYSSAASNFLVNARSWRLRELALSYSVPTETLTKSQNFIKGLTISVVGRNLALWLPKENKYMDPDFNSFYEENGNGMGMVTSSSNPPVRNFGFTVNAKF